MVMRVNVYGGKYTVIQEPGRGLRALRYGEEWRDCTGDGMILALAQEIEELREQVSGLKRKLVTIDETEYPDVPREVLRGRRRR